MALAGLMELEAGAPALLLLPARNKLGAALRLEARGLGLPETVTGDVDVLFALRYEPGDRTVRARDPEMHRLHVPGLAPDATRSIEIGTRALLSRMTGEVVLHRFTDRDLALPDVMGLQPGNLVVQERGLDVEFVPKPRP
ncbi:MAG: DUF1439 domain-containing protein [Comamonadaceae bacterium]|nr:MAG: DUF1439 domain-containing protein [Comamonadaceae bacterium]